MGIELSVSSLMFALTDVKWRWYWCRMSTVSFWSTTTALHSVRASAASVVEIPRTRPITVPPRERSHERVMRDVCMNAHLPGYPASYSVAHCHIRKLALNSFPATVLTASACEMHRMHCQLIPMFFNNCGFPSPCRAPVVSVDKLARCILQR